MPAFNFQTRFAPLVLSGKKTSTIRSREAKVGGVAHLFTGMRTKKCERLGRGEIVHCTPVVLGYRQNGMPRAKLGDQNHFMSKVDLDDMARADGFAHAREMLTWFEQTYKTRKPVADGGFDVFSGWLISWVLES